jgi:RimJ/RimL family protein N-acetyltransferase
MLIGERTRLRRVERDDLSRIVAWLNEPAVRENLLLAYPLSRDEEERWYEDVLKQEPATRPFIVEIPAPTGAGAWSPIGIVAFHGVDWRARSGEVGIFLGDTTVWGRGYGTDALRTLVRWGFEELNLNRVWLRVYDDNGRAIRSYEKLGLRHEGRLRQERFHRGRYADMLILGLLREEFR